MLNLFAVKSNTLNRLFHPYSLLRVFDLTANKFVYALIAESLSTLQAADTSQAFITHVIFLCKFKLIYKLY